MLDIRNLRKQFDGLVVLDRLNLSVSEHEILAIVGPSGCGKSTLLNLIAGTLKDYEGYMENQADKTGYVFQEDRLLPWLTVYDNIRIVRKREDPARIRDLIHKMRLEGFEHYYPDQLSGGMRQRCGIARAFYYGSQLLLMDEPFQSLDVNLRVELLEHLVQLWETERSSVIFVTHDIDDALMAADRVLVFAGRPARVQLEVSLPAKTGLRDLAEEDLARLKQEMIHRMQEN